MGLPAQGLTEFEGGVGAADPRPNRIPFGFVMGEGAGPQCIQGEGANPKTLALLRPCRPLPASYREPAAALPLLFLFFPALHAI